MIASLVFCICLGADSATAGQTSLIQPQRCIGLAPDAVKLLLGEGPALATVTGQIANPSVTEFYSKAQMFVCYGSDGVVIRAFRAK